jgi:hypothetical protein
MVLIITMKRKFLPRQGIIDKPYATNGQESKMPITFTMQIIKVFLRNKPKGTKVNPLV